MIDPLKTIEFDSDRKKKFAVIHNLARKLMWEIQIVNGGMSTGNALHRLREAVWWAGDACRVEQLQEAGE